MTAMVPRCVAPKLKPCSIWSMTVTARPESNAISPKRNAAITAPKAIHVSPRVPLATIPPATRKKAISATTLIAQRPPIIVSS